MISKLHFKLNISTLCSETHIKTERRVEKGRGELRERQINKTILALSV